jgi:mRNA interferase RelE/StbE
MNVKYKPSFHRAIKKITDGELQKGIAEAINSVKNAKTVPDIPNLRKMIGYKISYRIRIGNYRIGITIKKDLVTFAEFADRKNFYKFFPKKGQ